jgi:hypothetical protein
VGPVGELRETVRELRERPALGAERAARQGAATKERLGIAEEAAQKAAATGHERDEAPGRSTGKKHRGEQGRG